MKVTRTNIEYGCFGRCVKLENESLELVVTLEKGPRVIRFALSGDKGENVFAELPDEGFDTDNGFWNMLGGHRLWHSPEASPRTYTPDLEPVVCEEIENGVRVIQRANRFDFLQKEMEFTLSGGEVRVLHRIVNHSLWPVEFSVWALSVMRAGGVLIVPQNKRESGLLPNRNVIYWPYTDVRDPRASLGNDYMLVTQRPGETPFMFGQANESGWAAYAVKGCLFVKNFEHDMDAVYPDYGCSFESYCCDFMLEVESLSPLKTVLPGDCHEHAELWRLFGGAKAPENEAQAGELAVRLGLKG